MSYAALTILFLLLCVAIGAHASAAGRTGVAVLLALGMAVVQLALLQAS